MSRFKKKHPSKVASYYVLTYLHAFASVLYKPYVMVSRICNRVKPQHVPGTNFQSTNKILGKTLQFLSSLGLQSRWGASKSLLFTYYLPQILTKQTN